MNDGAQSSLSPHPRPSRKWLRRVVLVLLPVVILPIVLAISLRKLRQLQEPVVIRHNKAKSSQALFEEMDKEATLHPYARSISVSWSQFWPEKSGMVLSDGESLEWDRGKATLQYSTYNYGWTYSQVERDGITLLAKARLGVHPLTFAPRINSQLRSLGWVLTERYLP